MINKGIIKRNFSRCARYYDRYCTVQNFCASKLITKISENSFENILDIGCGTGNYTKLLRDKFPKAQIKAIDISREMIEVAKEKLQNEGIEFIIADAETANLQERFDLISSNASFQWLENLEQALLKYRKLLKENGVISFSIFGPLTFYELDKSLRELSWKEALVSSSGFIKETELFKILKRTFKKIGVEQERHKQRYDSLQGLLKSIKYTGVRGNGVNCKGFWTQKMLNSIEKIYKRRFKGIVATYQIFFCKGIK